MSDARSPVVFLFDVDNTLLDNDSIVRDLELHLDSTLGADGRRGYFGAFDQIRRELGYADYLGALQRYRAIAPDEVRLHAVSAFLIEYPFAARVYPGALEVVARCGAVGPTVVLSDGDVVFQPWKAKRSGIADAVKGRVLIYVHKEEMLGDVERRYPAAHYVFIDDKPRLAAAIKGVWGDRVTTVLPRQGHYANDPDWPARYPAPDLLVERIGDLLTMDPAAFGAGKRSSMGAIQE